MTGYIKRIKKNWALPLLDQQLRCSGKTNNFFLIHLQEFYKNVKTVYNSA